MSLADSALDAFWQAPPLARTAATSTLVLSLAINFGFLSYETFVFHPYFLWQFPPQVWRIVTAFCITGPKLGILFDTYFLFSYLRQIEVGNSRFPRKQDVIWYLMFVSGMILALNWLFSLPYMTFLPALIIAMCYTITQDQRGMNSQFYVITIPAQLMPICMILVNFLFPGGVAVILLQLEGLVAAHMYDFLSRLWPEFGGGRNLIATPAFLSRIVQSPAAEDRGYGTAFKSRGSTTAGAASGSSAGPLPDSWRTRGSGQRLG